MIVTNEEEVVVVFTRENRGGSAQHATGGEGEMGRRRNLSMWKTAGGRECSVLHTA